MLETVVDEVSYVVLNEYIGSLDDYDEYAKKIVYAIDKALGISKCFVRDENTKGFAGYDVVYSFGSWKCVIAYNKYQPKMGLYFKLTGVGLKQLLSFKKDIMGSYEVYNLTQDLFIAIRLVDSFLNLRMSKVDFAIDYIDEGLTVNGIYDRLVKSIIRNDKGRKNQSKIRTVVEDGQVQTIYIGNHRKKGGAKVYARIYDKKVEQMELRGIYYDKASKCNDWVRFEVSFGKELAHSICDDMMSTFTNEDLTSMIFRRITDKYRFYDEVTGEVWPETAKMLSWSDESLDMMGNPEIQKTDLLGTYQYLTGNSGLLSFMYKISQLYGENSVDEFLINIKNEFGKYRPTKEVQAFINERKKEGEQEKLPWKKN